MDFRRRLACPNTQKTGVEFRLKLLILANLFLEISLIEDCGNFFEIRLRLPICPKQNLRAPKGNAMFVLPIDR